MPLDKAGRSSHSRTQLVPCYAIFIVYVAICSGIPSGDMFSDYMRSN